MARAPSFLIISSESDRYFIIEAHNDENGAMERMTLYFESSINPPIDYDTAAQDFSRC